MKFQLLIKIKNAKKTQQTFLAFNLTNVVFIMLINVKMPTIVGILTFNLYEHDKFYAELS